MAFLEDSIKALASASEDSFENSKNFMAVREHLPAENFGYFYADIEHIVQIVDSQLSDFEREDYETNVQPFLEPIRAVGASADVGGVEQGISKGTFFVLVTE